MLGKLIKNRSFRASFALLLLLSLLAALWIDRRQHAEQDQELARYIVGASWTLSEYLFEAQRYDTALSDILSGRISLAELRMRHDILWSRLDIIEAQIRMGNTEMLPILKATQDLMAANDRLLFGDFELTFFDLAKIRENLQDHLLEVRGFWVENVVANQNRLNLLDDHVDSTAFWDLHSGWDVATIAVILALSLFSVFEFIQSGREAERERRLHIAAKAASAAKSRFLANVSHEVRTPLNGILGMAQALHETPLTADQADLVDTVSSSGEYLLRILNEVLDLSKVEAGRMELDPGPVDLGAMLHRLGLAHSAAARAKGISLETWFAPHTDQFVLLDEMRVQQMLNNLLSNAIKFTAEGSVTFEALIGGAGSETTVVFTISDTGIGMSPDQVSQVFEPFTQADSSTTRSFGGTGLGLALVAEMSKLAGGSVTVESTPGIGSTFRLTLPTQIAPPGATAQDAADADEGATDAARLPAIPSVPKAPPDPDGVPDTAAVPSEATTSNGKGAPGSANRLFGLRVLVVDDSRINRRVLSRFLAFLQAEVVEACDGKEGLARALEGGYDTALVDVQMPQMDGPEMARRLRAAEVRSGAPRLPIVGVTANVQPEQIADYLEAGMDHVLPKPLKRDALFAVLDALIAQRDAA